MPSTASRQAVTAAGTSPNVIYEKEKPGTFKMDEWRQFFQPFKVERGDDGGLHVVETPKGEAGFFTSYEHEGKFISYYGDNHPTYAGNVVKAMASAKHGYEKVVEVFADELAARILAEDIYKPLASGKPGKTLIAEKGEEITMPRQLFPNLALHAPVSAPVASALR